MVSMNNAAGRLHTVLTTMRDQGSINKAAWFTWPQVLAELHVFEEDERPEGDLDTATLLRRLAPIVQLPSKVREQIEEVVSEDEVHRYTEHVHTADKTIQVGLNFDQQWKEVIKHIGEGVLTELNHCDITLSKYGVEPTAELHRIREIQQKVQYLLDEVESSSSITPKLRDYLLRYLSLLDNALRQYRVSGMEGIQQAAYAATGAWAVEQPDDRSSKSARDISTKFSIILSDIYYIVGIGKHALELVKSGPLIPVEMFCGDVPQLGPGDEG